MRKQISSVILVTALPALSACGQPVPEDRAAYVGEWHAPAMDVQFTRDGIVRYKRVRHGTAVGEATTTINAPLRRFEGDNFVVGLPFLSTTFEVSTPPHHEAGIWRMVVDGVELTRIP
jgi:predicted small lipoprotein YifL